MEKQHVQPDAVASESSRLLPTSAKIKNQGPILAKEVKEMLMLAYPVIITYVLEFCPGIIGILLVGHIESPHSEEFIDAAALAVMFCNLTALSIGLGLATALDTLCSQAYGAKNTKNIGVYLQTGMIVLGIALIPMSVVNYYCTDILLWLDQPRFASESAGQFARLTLPGLPALFVYELFKKALQAMNNVKPMLYVAIIGNIVNAVLGYVLTYHTAFGFLGPAVARSIANFVFPVLLAAYLKYSGIYSSFWSGWRFVEAVHGIRQFLYLGVSGMMMLCFEWWAFEIVALLAGLLPYSVIAIGSNAILLNTIALLFMFYLGISVAGSVRVGNALGANKPVHARAAAYLTLLMSGCWSLVSASVLVLTRNEYPKLFTVSDEIADLTAKVTLVAASFQLADGVNAAAQGVFRGSGRQVLGAKLNLLAFYGVGLPCGAVLEFWLGYGLIGLWLGMTIGLVVVCLATVVCIVKSDWKQLAQEALKRVRSESG